MTLIPREFTVEHYQMELDALPVRRAVAQQHRRGQRDHLDDHGRKQPGRVQYHAATLPRTRCTGPVDPARLSDPGFAALHPALHHHVPHRPGQHLYSLIITYLTFQRPLLHVDAHGLLPRYPAGHGGSGQIDGCTGFQSFYKILLPLSAPGLVAAGIFSFTLAWNEFLYALVFITSSKLQTVPVGLASHIVADIYMWGPLMAGATMAAIPVIVLYVFAQRFLVQGLFAGSVNRNAVRSTPDGDDCQLVAAAWLRTVLHAYPFSDPASRPRRNNRPSARYTIIVGSAAMSGTRHLHIPFHEVTAGEILNRNIDRRQRWIAKHDQTDQVVIPDGRELPQQHHGKGRHEKWATECIGRDQRSRNRRSFLRPGVH